MTKNFDKYRVLQTKWNKTKHMFLLKFLSACYATLHGRNFEDDTDLLFLSGFPVWVKF